MKILSGKYRNRNFYMPQDVRPTTNMVRKAVFDILGHDLKGVTILDLFGGSGAVALEGISLGVKQAVIVEKSMRHAQIIQENVKLILDEDDQRKTVVMQADAFSYIKNLAAQEKKFDVVFIDPPFGRKLAKKCLKLLEAYDILQPHCFVVVQYEKNESLGDFDDNFTQIVHRKYGLSLLTIYERRA